MTGNRKDHIWARKHKEAQDAGKQSLTLPPLLTGTSQAVQHPMGRAGGRSGGLKGHGDSTGALQGGARSGTSGGAGSSGGHGG